MYPDKQFIIREDVINVLRFVRNVLVSSKASEEGGMICNFQRQRGGVTIEN